MKLAGPETTPLSTAPPTWPAEICQACHHCPWPDMHLSAIHIYGGAAMTKTLIDIDDELLAEAATILGTSSIKDTVNAALADVLGGALTGQGPVVRPQRDDLLGPT
jgi:hypothetical protein